MRERGYSCGGKKVYLMSVDEDYYWTRWGEYLWRVWSLQGEEKKNGEGQTEGGAVYVVTERDREERGIKVSKYRGRNCFQNIWEPSGSQRKNAGISWKSLLPSLRCFPTRLLHIQLTPSSKDTSREGWGKTLQRQRETCSQYIKCNFCDHACMLLPRSAVGQRL